MNKVLVIDKEVLEGELKAELELVAGLSKEKAMAMASLLMRDVSIGRFFLPGNLLAEFKKDKYTPAFDGKTLQFSFDVEDIPSQMLVIRSNLHILILASDEESEEK